MHKILIAVSSKTIASVLAERLSPQWDIRICSDSDSATYALQTEHPDALILDLFLTGKNGLSVLADCFPDLPPAIVALTPILNSYTEACAARWGVDYIFQVPVDIDLLVACLGSVSIFRTIAAKRLAQHLRVLGVTTNYHGYFHLLVGIPYFAEDFEQHLGKEIYSRIGERLSMDPRAVEKDIRTAVKAAWKNHRVATWGKYFPIDEAGDVACPTNKEFISTLAQLI